MKPTFMCILLLAIGGFSRQCMATEAVRSKTEEFDSLICTSIELEKLHVKERHSNVLLIIGEIAAIFPQNAKTDAALKRRLATLRQQYEGEMKWFDDLSGEMKDGDKLYHFRKLSGDREEVGYLIMHGKDIRRKLMIHSSQAP